MTMTAKHIEEQKQQAEELQASARRNRALGTILGCIIEALINPKPNP